MRFKYAAPLHDPLIPAAVDRDGGAGDVAAPLGGQKGHQRAEFFGRPQPPMGMEASHLLTIASGVDPSFSATPSERVRTRSVSVKPGQTLFTVMLRGATFVGEGLCEPDHAGLGWCWK